MSVSGEARVAALGFAGRNGLKREAAEGLLNAGVKGLINPTYYGVLAS